MNLNILQLYIWEPTVCVIILQTKTVILSSQINTGTKNLKVTTHVHQIWLHLKLVLSKVLSLFCIAMVI